MLTQLCPWSCFLGHYLPTTTTNVGDLTTQFACRQSHDKPDGLSYRQSIAQIIKKDGGGARGALGVFGRGLGGRVAASALQVRGLREMNGMQTHSVVFAWGGRR